MKRAVFLDRDGVLNEAVVRHGRPYPPKDLSELVVLPGVEGALNRLRLSGYLLIVVTNQPDVSRGATTKDVVEKINTYLESILPIDEFRTCYHDSGDCCQCRKPQPGALLAAGQKYDIDMSMSFMVGDRWRDVEAGQRAGCRTFFIDYGYSERQPDRVDFRVTSLKEVADIILGEI
jgi:D-glycero-D-manno-heptose 1,7-bisphosphate phosphatase